MASPLPRTPAMRHLSTEPRWAGLIARVGPPRLAIERDRSPYEALLRAIAHQQLHGRAAEAILTRFAACGSAPPGPRPLEAGLPEREPAGMGQPGAALPDPAALLALPEARLRACGFSGAKVAALRAIATHAAAGAVPTRRAAARLSDAALIERLTQIRGVGRWTVEMLLIFTLGRPDVLPVDDFGVREGYRALLGLEAPPKPRALAEIGAAWAPFRSTAAWYLWRAAELGRAG